MTWDFNKLPPHEHAGAVDAFTRRDIGHLIYLHDRYELSHRKYCCDGKGNFGDVHDNFEIAIQNQFK